MRFAACGMRQHLLFFRKPQAARRTPWFLYLIIYTQKIFKKIEKKFAKNFILAPAVFNIASAIHF